MKPTRVRGKSSPYRSKRPVQNLNSASISSDSTARSSQDNDEVVVAQVTPYPAKPHRVIPREESFDNAVPFFCPQYGQSKKKSSGKNITTLMKKKVNIFI